jgi:Tol biopolymer transport system component
MKRVLLGALALSALVTGCASSGAQPLRQAKPLRGVLVYAKAVPPYAPNSSKNVWVANAAGGLRRILVKDADGPAVSPDGRYVAYCSGGKVLVVPTAGGRATALYTIDRTNTAVCAPLRWAPDSRHLGFETTGLVVIDVRSGKVTTSTQPIEGFAFSPDSRRIAYSNGDLFVMPVGGGPSIRLTDNHQSLGPVWGKAGIAFIRFTHDAHGDIWLTGDRRHTARQLTHTGDAFYPAFFSADGKELLAANPATHNGRLWAVDVPTGNARALTPWVGDLFPQGLSRDGRTVLASIGCGGMIGPYGVVETIPFAGGKSHVIVHGPCRASWNAG